MADPVDPSAPRALEHRSPEIPAAIRAVRSVLATKLADVPHATLARLLAVILIYVAAARLMMLDPWFSGDTFVWRQSSIIVLLGMLLVSAIAFEWHLLGISRGLNLVGQIVLAYPFTLFVARLLGQPLYDRGGTTVIGALCEAVGRAGSAIGIDSLIPAWLSDALATPGTALVLVALCVVTTVGGSALTRIGLTIGLFTIPLAVAFSQSPIPGLAFIAGTVVMVAGMYLQYHDVEKYYRDREILERLRNVTDELERRACLRLVSRAWSDGRLGEAAATGLVRQTYERVPDLDETSVREITRGITYDLVTTLGLLQVRHDSEGSFLVPPPADRFEVGPLEQVARMPRLVVSFGLALCWVLMPFDLVPDALPVVGAVDDVLIMGLAGWPLARILEEAVDGRRPRGRGR